MKTLKQFIEDIGGAISADGGNTAGCGLVAGLGVGPEGEPGVHMGNKKKKNPILLPMMSRKK
ncbi:hypothetical protein UFOVP1655_176 [uncultured Caudovirales phage]|uniref:Uncharacterized protein n=1 Tax=uncultured Caudovirales phage TaxID=2100421 RepID=A0A6J5T4F5_9CAUD|nr:hypothetical protein UFOVP1655_176 [uncultured Caudovirales phage]